MSYSISYFILACNEPAAREDHSTVRIGDYLYTWVGNQGGLPQTHDDEYKRAFCSRVERFNLNTGQWDYFTTIGNPPLGVYRYTTAVIGNEIFYFGGHCSHGGCFHNSLYSLNVSTFKWTQLSSTHTRESCGTCPSMKDCCGMVPLCLDGNYYLAVVGGWGSSHTQPGAEYRNSFNNEVHFFELATCKYKFMSVIITINYFYRSVDDSYSKR